MTAQLSRMLFEARELIDMSIDITEKRTGQTDAWSRRVRDEIDQYRLLRGWSPHGFGGEDAPDPKLWYVLVCANCGSGLRDPLPMPFPSKETRAEWADGHMRSTGHAVLLMNQSRSDEPAEPTERGGTEPKPSEMPPGDDPRAGTERKPLI